VTPPRPEHDRVDDPTDVASGNRRFADPGPDGLVHPESMTTLTLHPAEFLGTGLWSPERRGLTIGLVLTVTLVAVEALAIATVMPVVAAELGDFHLYGWAFSAFFLGNLVGIAVVGGVLDRGGLVRPFAAGLVLFSIGLLVAGLAPSMPALVAGRLLQGLGAGAIPPIAYVAIGRALPGTLRAPMLAVLSTAWVLPGLFGPALSGAVAELTSWRLIFLGLLPLIAVAGFLTLPSLRAVPGPDVDEAAHAADAARSRKRIRDALILTAGASILLAGVTSGSIVPGLPLVVIGGALLVPALRALTPPGTLRLARGMPAAVLLRGMLTFAFFTADAFITLALHDWRGTSVAVAGIALTAATLAWTAGAWIQARQATRWGSRRLVALGFGTLIVGIGAFGAVLVPEVPVVAGVVGWSIAGLGMGFAYATLTLVVLAEAAPGTEGSASSGLQISDVLGTALGTGIGGAILAAVTAAGASLGVGLAASFAVGTGVAVIGLVGSVRLPATPGAVSDAARAGGPGGATASTAPAGTAER
jgi:MFS family permease